MQHFIRFAACALLALMAFVTPESAAAQDKPTWASRGVGELNRSRSNDTYEIKVVESHDVNHGRLERMKLQPLLMHIRQNMGAEPDGLAVDSIAQPDGSILLSITYFDKAGDQHNIKAKRIDAYSNYDDFEVNSFEWQMWQLYAIGKPDVEPRFDEFEITHSYNSKALAMSIIPGWGQLYKGQTAKGCVIMGVEAVSIAAAILGQHKMNYMRDEAEKHIEDTYASWMSKANSWKNVRNVAIVIGVGTYVYNLIDAATSKGARRVMLHKSNGSGLTFAPMIDTEGHGLTLAYRF
ncbi:MAG: hypothetical protein K2G07_04430 [Muribaculaceae bacterium]|nr:hypothetical protein [Muribaculaceae bacterium]